MDKLIGLRESGEIAGKSASTMYKLAKSGALPFYKLGSTWVIPKSALYRALGLELPPDGETHEKSA